MAVPFPFLYRERERSVEIGGAGQWLRCHPADVRVILSACSRDSKASPSRSFFTASVSRIFARVSTLP